MERPTYRMKSSAVREVTGEGATIARGGRRGPPTARGGAAFLLAAWLGLGGPVAASAETVSLWPAADTGLLEVQSDFNLGGQEDFPAGTLGATVGETRSRVLVRFDLGAVLPPDARIVGATLRLSVTRVPDGGGANSRFGLHRMLRIWNEGVGRGSPPGGARAAAGETTWTARSQPGELWETPGGQAGVDYVGEPGSTERILQVGQYEFEFGPNQLAELEDWLRHPETNHGWMLRSEEEETARTARRFASREHPDPELRPTLVLEVEAGTGISAPIIKSWALEGGKAVVVWGAEAGIRYTLEAAGQVPGGVWEAVAGTVTTNQVGDLRAVDGSGIAPPRFYRIRSTR